jgi:prepilin-type N-terminal cleavage/methylation domain-containing protein
MFIAAKQRGDTLVEVLICIAIVGAVIAGAYSLASRSLQEGVSAAEHSDAVKLAEGQIEALKLRQAGSDKDEWATYFASSDHINNTCLDLTSKTQTDTNWIHYYRTVSSNNYLFYSVDGYTRFISASRKDVL